MKYYFHGIYSVLVSTFSIVYWVRPQTGWRLVTDKFFAKSSFVLYFVTGVYYGQSIFQTEVIMAVPLTTYMLGFYTLSCIFFNNEFYIWVYLHVFFHVFASWSQLNVLFIMNKQIESQL